ncbi:uncharacterized protein LOC114349879 [Ostrinia furnacalis]|uniref:uncharacterized protein LOC114349879 n=1 Tax=Ostrinia furnacalis TaxID=93504 RepID=UPI0010398D86|nr:uncharacterized protein LOC114349879 [Ostrinia furnacalis]
MTTSHAEDQFSDEEVFFGKITLKEIKKHIIWNNHLPRNKGAASRDGYDDGLKIIETHSAPNLIRRDISPTPIEKKATSNINLSPDGSEVYSRWDIKQTDDSFLKVEKMVADMCVSSPTKNNKKEEALNNTLDIIDYILKTGSPNILKKVSETAKPSEISPSENSHQIKVPQNVNSIGSTPSVELIKPEKNCNPEVVVHCTPSKTCSNICEKTDKNTPYTGVKQKTPMFRTPRNPISHKKPSDNLLKKTPGKNHAYQHIASPVASYIKQCPVAPLVKDVRPSKPLPGSSSIPKLVKTNSTQAKLSNKENLQLPSVAYRSAKKTQVIHVPDEEKLPQSHWMKKITSSLPKPLIMKHDHRETNLIKRVLVSRQEDSFADLSLRQADVSVCTQKSAFNKPKGNCS